MTRSRKALGAYHQSPLRGIVRQALLVSVHCNSMLFVSITVMNVGSPSPELGPVPFPRATSEPPPEVDEPHLLKPPSAPSQFGAQSRRQLTLTSSEHPSTLKLALPEAEEYSWEWGNFPQKTPVWTAFNHGQIPAKDVKGKARMSPADTIASSDYWSHDTRPCTSHHRSWSLGRSSFLNCHMFSARLPYRLWLRWSINGRQTRSNTFPSIHRRADSRVRA